MEELPVKLKTCLESRDGKERSLSEHGEDKDHGL